MSLLVNNVCHYEYNGSIGTKQSSIKLTERLCHYEYNGSIGTKQSSIKLTERLLNSYGDKLMLLQTD